MNNETISIQKELYGGYRIISKASQFNSLNKDYRTFTISFGTHLSLEEWTLPIKAIFFATSLKNSFEYEHHFFGAPHVTEVITNHHSKVSFNVKMNQRSKEKHPDCVEKTWLEVLEEILVPLIKKNCPNPCSYRTLPTKSLKFCDYTNHFDPFDEWNPDFDYLCSENQYELAFAEFSKLNYSYKPCYIEEYQGKLIEDEIIDGMQDIFLWDPLYENDMYFPSDITPYYDAQIPSSIKFSYTFEQPEIATVLVEDFIVTFVDLVGIVGGTLGMFIGFAFYDNIMTSVEYVITFVEWAKRMRLKRRSRKVAKVQEDPSTKKIETKSELMNTKMVVETNKENTTISKKEAKSEPSPLDTHSTLSKDQTKDVKESKTKKIQVTRGKEA